MHSTRRGGFEASKPQLIEWRVCEDEREWQEAKIRQTENCTLVVQSHPWMRQWALRWAAPALPILLVLALVGGRWLWYRSQIGLDAIETELQVAVDAESWLMQTTPVHKRNTRDEWQAQFLREAEHLNGDAEPGEVITEMQVVDLGQDWAVLQVVIQMAGETKAFRQTRVYQKTLLGWVRAAPTATYWGHAHQLESRYFIFHYFTRDAAAVEDAAERLDALYLALHSTFFPEPPGDEKLVIEIDPTRIPGQMSWQTPSQGSIVLASPVATLAPVELTAADLLAQSLMLALFDQLADEARLRYDLLSHWQSLRNGLRLWLIWEQELPLAVWREPLVKWVFWDSQITTGHKFPPEPEFAHDLCVHHQLWMRTPLDVVVPVTCFSKRGSEEKIISWRYPYPPPQDFPLPLHVSVPVFMQSEGTWEPRQSPEVPAAEIALATVVEYAATTFGPDRLPVLLAALSQHEEWEAVLQTTFGLSLAEFDSGWRTFLAERYGISREGN